MGFFNGNIDKPLSDWGAKDNDTDAAPINLMPWRLSF